MNSPVQLLGQAAALKRCRTRIVSLLQELACVQSSLRLCKTATASKRTAMSFLRQWAAENSEFLAAVD